MKQANKGTGTRFDRDFGGNHVQKERDNSKSAGLFLSYTRRFCQHCQQMKPKGKRKAVKSWKCEDCLGLP